MEGPDQLLVLDYTTGNLHRLDLKTKSFDKINGGFGGGDGLTRDTKGRLFASNYKTGQLFVLDKPESKPQIIPTEGLASAADISISPDGKYLMVPDMEKGKLFFVQLP